MECCKRCWRAFCCYKSESYYEEPKAQQLILQNPFIGISDKRYLLLSEQVDPYTNRPGGSLDTQRSFNPPSRTDIFADCNKPVLTADPIRLHHKKELVEARSFEDLSAIESPVSMKKCKSMTMLYKEGSSGPVATTILTLIFNYDVDNQLLIIYLDKLSNIPKTDIYTDIYIVMKVFPEFIEGFTSEVVPARSRVEFIDNFQLDNLTPESLLKSTFRITVLGKDGKRKSIKDAVLCEGFIKGQDVDWINTQNEEIKVNLKKKWLKRLSTYNKFLESDLGELFVLLQYQSLASRMKVLLRKASNLPKSDKLIGIPGHSVIINLYKDNEIISSRETQVQGGLHPVWNQPFLFTIPNNDTDSYNLEFIIKRIRRYTKDIIIGHVLVGTQAPKSGRDQWKEAMKPRGLECALWHSITAIFTYKS